MKKVFKYCFDKWWRPVIILVLTGGLLYISDQYDSLTFSNISFFLFLISLVGILSSLIYNFTTRQWENVIITTIVLGLTVFVVFVYSFMSMFAYHPDHYADNLKIPTDIQINLPHDRSPTSKMTTTDFQLYNSLQPGLYQYVFGTSRIEKGKVYLKAFEITHNDPLSAEYLPKTTLIEIYNPTDTLIEFSIDKGNSSIGRPFTIYEGEWGKPYAARFEVWFVPDKGGKERKLIQKNYKIEGWQR